MRRLILPAILLIGCGGGSAIDAGRDAARPDAGRDASGRDSSVDASSLPDSSSPGDSGSDAGTGGTLADRYPGDEGIDSDPSVIFHDDFESGWGRWDAPAMDTRYLTILEDGVGAHGGSHYLQSKVTTADLAADMYISASPRVSFDRVDEIWWRFHARFPVVAPNPHHWVRMAAGNATWDRSGLANTVPAGDEGFWFDFDANNDDQFNFYVYWYGMRSGRCNDGSATPGCAGDQGTTYHYGNVFRPPDQTFLLRDEWFCIELHAKTNTVGTHDGALSYFIDDALIGDYREGYPDGTWLRAQFHTDGCTFSACTDPVPFEGFDFRSDAAVGFKAIYLDAYYERDSSARKRQALIDRGLTPSDEQIIYYDDVVVATERIGCRR